MTFFKLLPLYLVLLVGLFLPPTTFAQQNQFQPAQIEVMEAKITTIKEEAMMEFGDSSQLSQTLEAQITNGPKSGQTVTIMTGNLPTLNARKYQVGDEVVLNSSTDLTGNQIFFITDYIRRAPLYWLFFIFAGLAVLIGRKRGVASLVGMAFSFFIIFKFILPRILAGHDPVATAIIGSLFIIPVTFFLSHGVNKKTTTAIIGTIISLVITGVLADIFVNASQLSGFASEEASFLQVAKQGMLNIKGLLLAGIIVGVLGILDDITVSQAAIVQQLKQTAPNLSAKQLFSKAMDIGRDHIASVVNTLVLVYAGASLPLLLLFIDNPQPFETVINSEIIAEELVRTFVASIGLILAVPITTIITVYAVSKSAKIK